MDYKQTLVSVIAYALTKIEMAHHDYIITRDTYFEGEYKAMSDVLNHIEILLSYDKEPDEQIKNCIHVCKEFLEGLDERKGDERLD